MNVFATFIVPTGLVTQARAKCKQAKDDPAINLPGLDGMFKTALVRSTDADGDPATHWVSSGWMSEAERDWLNANLPGPFESTDGTVEVTQPDGSKVRVPESVFETIARLGKKMRREPQQ